MRMIINHCEGAKPFQIEKFNEAFCALSLDLV